MSEGETEIFGAAALAAVDAPAQAALIPDLPPPAPRKGPGRPVGAATRNGAPDIVARIAELEAAAGVTVEELAFRAASGRLANANSRVLIELLNRKFGRQPQAIDVRKVGLTMVVEDVAAVQQVIENKGFVDGASSALGILDLESWDQVVDDQG